MKDITTDNSEPHKCVQIMVFCRRNMLYCIFEVDNQKININVKIKV